MNVTAWIKLYLVTLPVFFVLDILWLGFVGRGVYQHFLGHLMREKTVWASAIIFYLLFIVGLIYYGVRPALEDGRYTTALFQGGLFGFFTYMTYELTNHAVIAKWPLGIVAIDIAWGIVLSALVSLGSFLLGTKLLGLG